MKKENYYQNKEVEKIRVLEPWINQVTGLIPNCNHKILDVGCGEGSYSTLLKKDGNEVWGIELSEKAGKIARSQIDRVIIQDAEKAWSVPLEYFDVVTLLRYLEHVFDYNFQLRQCRRALKTGGQLVMYSPNISILEKIRLLTGRVPAYASDMEHIRQFTKPFLFKILRENGFKPIYCEGYKFVIPHAKFRIRPFEKIFPNSCPCIFLKAVKV